ncbi:MAG: bi-domain-containing oxidoreductase [Chitinophagaceae bacterium]|nr:bi-domain-containing oxidoreductase [Chitinophagaceae bacterium]
MKQIIQHLNNGETALVEVPAPMVKEGHVLIRSVYSLVSKGTESMLVGFGRANWLNKARQQPQQVKAVLDKVKTDGLIPTLEAVRSKLNQPIPLGYSNAGVVISVGAGVSGLKPGDRVASNGSHAEIVQVPQHLCARIPDAVSDETAAFTVVGAIALQGIRLLQPSFGETVVVFGLGLIGQLAVQLLLANGCRVIGIDTDGHKCALASAAGAQVICNADGEPVAELVITHTGAGADAVLITAAARNDSILADAAHMSRKRGRIVLVGVVNLDLDRADFYEKELSFQVSCSYGPGRYEYQYEQKSVDYPIGFVRWTAQRNFQAVLQAMAAGQLRTQALQTCILPLDGYARAYDPPTGDIATLFCYEQGSKLSHSIQVKENAHISENAVAVIGAGNFTAKVLVPLMKKAGTPIAAIASENGLSAAQVAKQYQIPQALTDLELLWQDERIGTVAITTRHNTHAGLCIRALQAGKNVFVEKPLALSYRELNDVKAAYEASGCTLDIGFNRRHAPLAQRMKQLIGPEAVVNIVITVNAGKIPLNSWLNDKEISGGRIIGEVCHFIDLACFLSGAAVRAVCTTALQESEEDIIVLLKLSNGSTAAIHYFSNGHKAYDKERVEVYHAGRTLVLENWKRLSGYGFKGFSSASSVQDKGHARQFSLLQQGKERAGQALIPFAQIYNVSAATIAAVQSLQEQQWITV